MLSYRAHIYSLAMNVSAEATTLALALGECQAAKQGVDDRAAKQSIDKEHLPKLRENEISLRAAADKLSEALPPNARTQIFLSTNLSRHLRFINYWLDRNLPSGCIGDPIDILKSDLPSVLANFETWYESQSPADPGLSNAVQKHILAGQLRTALRDAWPLFKTRMVNSFDLADNLDGHSLADALFGNQGATVDVLPGPEREGYLNLFKGLYALSRNPVLHGDVPEDFEESSAILALINSALIRIEDARRIGGSTHPGHLPIQKEG